MENNILYTQDETSNHNLNHRRRSMSEEMLLNSIAFKVQEKGDKRLLSGSRYDSLFARIEELKMERFLGVKYFAEISEQHGC